MKLHVLRRMSIRDRLRFFMLLASGLALLVFGVVFIVAQALAQQWEMVREFAREADHIEGDAGPALLAQDTMGVERALQAVRERDDVLVAVVYDMGGTVLAQHSANGRAVPPPHEVMFGTYFEGGELVLSEHILVEGHQVGALHLRASPVHHRREMWVRVLLEVVGLIAAFAVVFLLSGWLSRRIAAPFEQFAATAPLAPWAAKGPGDGGRDGEGSEAGGSLLLEGSLRDFLRQSEESDEALRREGERFPSLGDNALHLMLLVGPDGRIRFANTTAERVLGRCPGDLTGRGLSELLEAPEVEAADALRALFLRAGDTAQARVRLRHADGSVGTHRLTLTDLRADPLVCGVVLIGRELSAGRGG